MSYTCPFSNSSPVGVCPMKFDNKTDEKVGSRDKIDEHNKDSATISPKCPFGYDSHTFKLGPLSCMLCRSLLYESSKCVPCSHKFCKACISRFKDCPLCGADIEKIEPDSDLQTTVDRFIDGHARIKRSQVSSDSKEAGHEQKNVIYGDVSMERGAFLVQQAMTAFHGKNIESAKSRLEICVQDIREQLQTQGKAPELCSQLGAVLGMLGDCWHKDPCKHIHVISRHAFCLIGVDFFGAGWKLDFFFCLHHWFRNCINLFKNGIVNISYYCRRRIDCWKVFFKN